MDRITDPQSLADLAPGTYEVAGAAADEVRLQHLRQVLRQIGRGPHKPEGNELGQCVYCLRPVHTVRRERTSTHAPFNQTVTVVRWYLRHNPIPRLRVIPDRERTHCSSCNKPGAWYEFKPGDGRCNECAP